MIYIYEVVRTNAVTGKESEFREQYAGNTPLEPGRLYLHLPGRQGAYRVVKELRVSTQFNYQLADEGRKKEQVQRRTV